MIPIQLSNLSGIDPFDQQLLQNRPGDGDEIPIRVGIGKEFLL